MRIWLSVIKKPMAEEDHAALTKRLSLERRKALRAVQVPVKSLGSSSGFSGSTSVPRPGVFIPGIEESWIRNHFFLSLNIEPLPEDVSTMRQCLQVFSKKFGDIHRENAEKDVVDSRPAWEKGLAPAACHPGKNTAVAKANMELSDFCAKAMGTVRRFHVSSEEKQEICAWNESFGAGGPGGRGAGPMGMGGLGGSMNMIYNMLHSSFGDFLGRAGPGAGG